MQIESENKNENILAIKRKMLKICSVAFQIVFSSVTQ